MARRVVGSKISGLGMNYYHESMGYISRTNSEIAEDLTKIRTLTNRIKVYHSPYENAGAVSAAASLVICKNITEIAKSLGFYVVWVENHEDGDHLLTDGEGAYSWSEYSSLVIADAAEAQDSGADEFLVGNEVSIHNDSSSPYSDVNLPVNAKQLVTDCAGAFPGIRSWQDGWWKKDAWNTAGLGVLPKIYFTLYENTGSSKTYAQSIFNIFGNLAEIGEYGTKTTFSLGGYTEDSFSQDIGVRQDDYEDIGITNVWYFTFREGDGGFGMLQSGNDADFRFAWNRLSRGRNLFYL